MVKKGDTVTWNTPQGETKGKVTKRVGEDKFEVKSDKSGKTAQHKSAAFKKK